MTNKIMIDEAVVRQALESLEYWRTSPETCGFTYKARDAATALHQALADAALDKMVENARELGLSYEQPDRQATQDHAILNVLLNHCGKGLTPDVIDAIRSELQQEMRHGPCAWAFRDTTPPLLVIPPERPHDPFENRGDMFSIGWNAYRAALLKAAPAPAQPLTDKEIIEIAVGTKSAEPGRDGYVLPVTFARAIEAAHGITKGQP